MVSDCSSRIDVTEISVAHQMQFTLLRYQVMELSMPY